MFAPAATQRLFALPANVVGCLGPMVAAGLCLVLALPYLDHLADYDEFYTLLAARGWLETGAPVIADGEYPRALAFTLSQAAFFSIFGESLLVGRLPSLLSVMLLAAGLFVWLRHFAGTAAASFAAVIFAFTPMTIQMAQFGRFYAPHALTVGAAALLTYYASTATGRRRIVLGAAALVAVLLSMHLQSTTVIALCGLALWVAGLGLVDLARSNLSRPTKFKVIATVAGIGIAVAAVVVFSGVGTQLWSEFRMTTLWGSVPSRAGNVRFYHQALDNDLGFLWSLFPIAVIVAVASRRREMLFAAVFVATALVLHSLAGQKDQRYIFYILPFIAAFLGCGIATATAGYFAWLRRAITPLIGRHVSHAGRNRLAVVLVAVSAGFAFANNPPFTSVLRMLAGAPRVEHLDYSWIANWPAEADSLRPLIEKPAILVTSSGMKAIYYLGDYDFEMNANVADETDTRRDFGIDPRTGRQVVSSRESVELLMRCYPDIVFVADESRWSRDTAVPVATSALIEERGERLPTRPSSALLAFRVSNAAAVPSADFCKELRPGRRG